MKCYSHWTSITFAFSFAAFADITTATVKQFFSKMSDEDLDGNEIQQAGGKGPRRDVTATCVGLDGSIWSADNF